MQEPLSHLRRQVHGPSLTHFYLVCKYKMNDGYSEAVHLFLGDPSSSDEEHIRIMLVQTEIERVKFIMMSIRGCSR